MTISHPKRSTTDLANQNKRQKKLKKYIAEKVSKRRIRYEDHIANLKYKVKKIETKVDGLKVEVSQALRKERLYLYDGFPQSTRMTLMRLDNDLIDNSLELQTVRRTNKKISENLPVDSNMLLVKLMTVMADVDLMQKKYENAEEKLEYKYDLDRIIEEESIVPTNAKKQPRSQSL